MFVDHTIAFTVFDEEETDDYPVCPGTRSTHRADSLTVETFELGNRADADGYLASAVDPTFAGPAFAIAETRYEARAGLIKYLEEIGRE